MYVEPAPVEQWPVVELVLAEDVVWVRSFVVDDVHDELPTRRSFDSGLLLNFQVILARHYRRTLICNDRSFGTYRGRLR